MKIANEDISVFHEYKILVKKRTIYLGSESVGDDGEDPGTNWLMVERFVKNMGILEAINDKPITIVLNSCGGGVISGLAIYDRIKISPCHVTINVYGQASSMGSVILQSADVRRMSENSTQLIHYGQLDVSGEAKSAYKFMDEVKRTDKFVEKLYMEKIKKKDSLFKLGRLQRLLAHDTYLTAQQSVDLGLADEIIK